MLYSEIDTEYPVDGNLSTSFREPHPSWRPHLLQGWATDFIPKLVADAKELKLIDSVMHVGGDEAIQACRDLATQEGILTGPSGGGIVACALKLAEQRSDPNATILALIPDTGERYLSTPLFEDIPADMTEEELEIAKSTQSTPPPAPGLPSDVPEAVDFCKTMNKQHKVVVWSLQYCEFCWTLTRFLDALGVPYELINIDSFQYAKKNLGNKYRAALSDQTECNTFPQLFVNQKFIGGAVDACLMWKRGELQPLLEEAGLNNASFHGYDGDPFEFLPKWMLQNPHQMK